MLKRALESLTSRFAARPAWTGSAGACVLLIGRDGRIAGVSEAAATVTGVWASQLHGAVFAELFRPDDRGAASRALSLGGASGRVLLETDPAFGPSRRLDIAVSTRPDGRSDVLLLPARRETDEVAALREEAESARREAKQTADLLADLSHEMRTPLNAVIGFAGAMRAEMFGPLGHEKYDEYAEHIRASGEHLLDLVSSILDLAKIEADRFSLKREAVNAGALAEECAGIVRLQAEAAGLKLTTRISPEIPESFLDPRAVRQIVLNLLSNAVKFTSDGEITLTAQIEADEIVLTVTDTGVGMSDAEIAKLGSRFTAAHGDGVRGAKGAGLGLALAFALAELHGGSMKLSSAPGEGLTARVALPVVAPAAPARHRRAPAQAGANPALLTQLERIEAYRRERASAA
ncbi:MAG: HAMP domain-containing sensor histidine kinase [Pseudomonadota bacterium]|nr:HAMP domain-containing sensor histidine kinase [Pseudomonadota bacterium]